MIKHRLNRLSKQELIKLIQDYDDYIINFPEEHDGESYPVCLSEFYNCEYQEESEVIK